MRKLLVFLLTLLLLVSCATKAPEVSLEPEAVVEAPVAETKTESVSQPEAVIAKAWVNVPSSTVLTDEEWDALFNKPKEVVEEPVGEASEPLEEPVEEITEEITEALEEPEEIIEPVIEELTEVAESDGVIESDQNPVGTTVLSELETDGIDEQGEPSAEILADEMQEEFTVEPEEEIVMPEAEYEFAGEDYLDYSFILEEEEVVLGNVPEVETVITEAIIEPEEKTDPNIVAEIAAEYKELEQIDMAKPSFKETALAFLKKNILYIELVFAVFIAVIVGVILAKRTKKARMQAEKVPEVDEGEEIDMTPGYYVDPNAAIDLPERPIAEVKTRADEQEADYGGEPESEYEPEDESGYESEDDSEYEEDPGGYDDGF